MKEKEMAHCEPAKISISADFGGEDAASIALPHLKGLKVAAEGIAIRRFPYKTLAFILRVSGDVHDFGPGGVGNAEVDRRNREYLSIDIVLTQEDRQRINKVVSGALSDCRILIERMLKQEGISGFAMQDLVSALQRLRQQYKNALL